MMRVKRYQDRLLCKHRWQAWRSSDIVGGSTQGYADPADRDDNLALVLGGQLRMFGKNLYLVRPTVLLSDAQREGLRRAIDRESLEPAARLALDQVLADRGEWIRVDDV